MQRVEECWERQWLPQLQQLQQLYDAAARVNKQLNAIVTGNAEEHVTATDVTTLLQEAKSLRIVIPSVSDAELVVTAAADWTSRARAILSHTTTTTTTTTTNESSRAASQEFDQLQSLVQEAQSIAVRVPLLEVLEKWWMTVMWVRKAEQLLEKCTAFTVAAADSDGDDDDDAVVSEENNDNGDAADDDVDDAVEAKEKRDVVLCCCGFECLQLVMSERDCAVALFLYLLFVLKKNLRVI